MSEAKDMLSLLSEIKTLESLSLSFILKRIVEIEDSVKQREEAVKQREDDINGMAAKYEEEHIILLLGALGKRVSVLATNEGLRRSVNNSKACEIFVAQDGLSDRTLTLRYHI